MKRNIHSTHIEDLSLMGKTEVLQALSSLIFLEKKLGTLTDTPVISIKYDGYAIIAGWIGKRFFVSSKSLFNKESKINFTHEDIDKNHSGGLAKRLYLALKYLQPIIPKGKIYQGDYLFDNELLQYSKNYISFQPNTIQYSVEKNSQLGLQIQKAKIGIIFHTEYQIDGDDIQTIKIKSFNVNCKEFNKSTDVWLTDASLDLSSIAHLSEEEYNRFVLLVNSIKSRLDINWTNDTVVTRNLLSFVNSYIRENKFQNPENKSIEFTNWIQEKVNTEIAKRKTEKGKKTILQKWNSTIEYAKDVKNLTNLFTIHENITELKLLLIQKLNTVKLFDMNLLKSDNTLIPTENEGFVFTKTQIAGCKMVDRYTFSLANFSEDFKRGWTHD